MKRHYDKCFNSWFEGYLQPALDASHSDPVVENSTPESSDMGRKVKPIPPLSEAHPPINDDPTQLEIRTSWASSIGRRLSIEPSPKRALDEPLDAVVNMGEGIVQEASPIEVSGATKAQIKAAEYQRLCGEGWRDYQACLRVSDVEGQAPTRAQTTLINAPRLP